MVENSSLEKKLIWIYVKRLRTEYLIKNTDLTCEKNFIPLKNILENFENLSKMVSEENSQEISRNLSRSDINFGAEMFIALNSCPSFYVKLYWKAIYGSESRIAKLALNIIRKAKEDFKVKAKKIFSKISLVLGFQHIHTLNNHYEGNKSIDMNIDFSKSLLDIKGDIKLLNIFHDSLDCVFSFS